MAIRDEAAAMAGEIAALRHAIHREPEIGFDLPEHSRRFLPLLDGPPLEITLGGGPAR